MSTETRSTGPFPDSTVGTGAVGGLIGGLVLGVVVQIAGESANAPKLFGAGEGAVLGWLLMALVGLLGGVVFGAALRTDALNAYADTVGGAVGLGVGYAAVLWLVGGAFALPVAVNETTNATWDVPSVDPFVAVGLLGYGVVLGLVVGVLEDR